MLKTGKLHSRGKGPASVLPQVQKGGRYEVCIWQSDLPHLEPINANWAVAEGKSLKM